MSTTDRLALTKELVKKEAKNLQNAYMAGDGPVRELVEKKEKIKDGSITESQALRVVSRKYGVQHWREFQSYLGLDEGVHRVIEAVRFGDLERLRDVLQEHPEAANPFWAGSHKLRRRIPNSSVPLFMVCAGILEKTNEKGNTDELTKALLEAGADPEILNGIALKTAANLNLVEMSEVLLDHGANIDGPGNNGNPMAWALLFGWDVAKLLEKRGAKLDLILAAGLNRTDVMALFYNADGTLTSEAGDLYRKRCGDLDLPDTEVLAQALVYACPFDHVEAATFLLDRGADINAMTKVFDLIANGLHWAVRRGKTEVAKLMIERGADLTLKDKRRQMNALDWAESGGRDEIAELIRQKVKES